MRTILIATLIIALATMASWTFAQQDSTANSKEIASQTIEERQAEGETTSAGAEEMCDEQFAAFLMQLGVLSQRFERTTPEMRQALLVINSLMLIGSTEEDVTGYLGETLDLLESTNLPNPIDAPLKPTGNGLLDAYLAEVERQVYAMRLDAEDWSAEVESVGIPSPEFLAACAEEYGSEPDYWELKYIAALAKPAGEPQPDYNPGFIDPPGVEAMAQWEQAIGVFAEAEQAGCADSELMCNWYKELSAFHVETASKSRGESRDSIYTFFTDEMFGEELALLDRAIALDPENAWPYYQRALISLVRGDKTDGMRYLMAGHSAPEYTPPLLFTLREIRESFKADYPAGSAIADGAVLTHYLLVPGNHHMALNSTLTKRSIDAALANQASPDVELGNELWIYLVRTGQLNNLGPIDKLALVAVTKKLLMEICGENELQDKYPELFMLNMGLTRTITDAVISYPDCNTFIITMSVTGGMPGCFAGYYASEEVSFDPESETVAQAFADLAEFDIRTMTPPPSWEKYREVGAERLAKYEERKRQREQEQEAEESDN